MEIMFLILSTYLKLISDAWYVMDRGRDKGGCGRSPDSPCDTLLYLLQQMNQTHLPPSTRGDTSNLTPPVLPSQGAHTGNQTHNSPSSGDDTAKETSFPPSAVGDTGNWTHLRHSRELRIITDKSLQIDHRTAVSTIYSLP